MALEIPASWLVILISARDDNQPWNKGIFDTVSGCQDEGLVYYGTTTGVGTGDSLQGYLIGSEAILSCLTTDDPLILVKPTIR